MMTTLSEDADPVLLGRWLRDGHEPAFQRLVGRYAGLVRGSAQRICGDPALASDVAQLTFITLARKAPALVSHPTLAGWLHATAVHQARNALRKSLRENRKRLHLQATMDTAAANPSDSTWEELQPELEGALAALSATDREALLLRFYRSLSVREMAATLGIGVGAAQKRVDRATGRLRGKLVHRGCGAGTALSSTLAAGFVMDAQAAAPLVPILSAKAMAAGASGGATFATFLTIKSASIAATAVAVVASAIWVAGQFETMARLERQNALLEKHLAAQSTPASAVRQAVSTKTALDAKPVDWEEVAARLGNGGSGYLSTSLRLKEGLRAMDLAGLTAALDEIDRTKLSATARDLLEKTLGGLLMEQAPQAGLTRFLHRCHDDGWDYLLAGHFKRFAEKDPDAAVDWFKGSIAAGGFDSKRLGEGIRIPREMVSAPVLGLLLTAPDTSGRILSAVPEEDRLESLRSILMIQYQHKGHVEWARLVRENLSEKDRINAISWPLGNWSDGDGSSMKLSEVTAYLNRIGATPAEVAACVLAVTKEQGSWRKPGSSPDAAESFDALRAWVSTEAPGLLDRATAAALEEVCSRDSGSYPQLAQLALRYHRLSAADELLIPLLEAHEAGENKVLARSLAAKLSDAERRNSYLEKLQ